MKVESFGAPAAVAPGAAPPPPPHAATEMIRAAPRITAAVLRKGIPSRRMLHLIAVSRPGHGHRAEFR
ncbi:hypothetical protein GCM10023075_06300 [Streptosporangium album]